jgi:predicted nucleic acid-binding protein
MTVIFDSSAWIEYFAGSKKGKIVKEFLDKKM